MSATIGVRELKKQTSRIVRSVHEQMAEYVITVQDEPVAVLRPLTDKDIHHLRQAEVNDALMEMKALAQRVAAAWTSPKSGVELVNEQRR